MAWASAMPAVIGAIGTIGGAAIDKFGGQSSSGRVRANKYGGDAHRNQIASHWNETMRMAAKHKISPLAALGMEPSSGPAATVSPGHEGDTSFGDAFRKMGQDLSKSYRTPEQRKLASIAVEQELEKLNALKLGNAMKVKSIYDGDTVTGPPMQGYRSNQPEFEMPGQTQNGATHVFKANEIPRQDPNVFGKTAGTAPLISHYNDKQGYRHELPQKDVADTLESSPVSNARIIALQAGQIAKFRAAATTPNGRNWIRSIRPKAPPGYHYRLNETLGMWRMVSNKKGLRLFDTYNPLKGRTKYGKEEGFQGDLW